MPLKEGFRRIEQISTEAGPPFNRVVRLRVALPGTLTQQGFRAFNDIYVVTLGKWGIYNGGSNPVARSNVCPGNQSSR